MTAVVRTPTEDDRSQVIGVLRTSLNFTQTWADAVRLGYLDPGDPATGALERLFAGSDPWCPFFF